MAPRLTRVTLLVPWDDEDHEQHPIAWGYDVMLGIDRDSDGRQVVVVEALDVDERGDPV